MHYLDEDTNRTLAFQRHLISPRLPLLPAGSPTVPDEYGSLS